MSDRQALCCECGNLRTFRDGYAPRRYVGEGDHDGRGYSWGGRRTDPFERYTCDFKCQPCGKVTRHAIVRPEPPAGRMDPSEASDQGWELMWTGQRHEWRRKPTGKRAAVEALGLTIVEVPNLKDCVSLVRDQRVVLVRAGLDAETLDWAWDWLLERADDFETS